MSPSNATHTADTAPFPPLAQDLKELRSSVRTGLHDTAQTGRQALHAVGDAAAHTAQNLRSSAMEARDKAAHCIAERPFTSVAIAAGIGALVGAAIMFRRR